MDFYLDRHHPKDLITALSLIQDMDDSEQHTVSFFDFALNAENLNDRVLILVDAAKDLEATTKLYKEKGGRVFALKFPKNQVWDFHPLSIAVMDLWPKLLQRIKEVKEPFVSKYFCDSCRLMPAVL